MKKFKLSLNQDLIIYPSLLILMLAFHAFLAEFFHNPELASIVVSVTATILVWILEKIYPYRVEWNKNVGDLWTDIAFTLLLFPLITTVVRVLLAFALQKNAFLALWNLGQRFETVPAFLQFPFWLLIAELGYYAYHRLCHHHPWFWSLHKSHHSPLRVYWANSGRFHPADMLIGMFIYFLPFYVFQASPEVLAWFLSFNAVTGLLEHANIQFRAGLLNRIFNTAELHRWHHSVVPEISGKNLGKVLCVWDQLFGTYYLPKNQHVERVGVEEP